VLRRPIETARITGQVAVRAGLKRGLRCFAAGSCQVSERTRDGNPGRGNESMGVEENGTMVTLNLPNSGMLVYLPCSGRRYKLEHSGANHCEGV